MKGWMKRHHYWHYRTEKFIKKYYIQPYSNKLDKLDKTEKKFLERHKLLILTQEKVEHLMRCVTTKKKFND